MEPGELPCVQYHFELVNPSIAELCEFTGKTFATIVSRNGSFKERFLKAHVSIGLYSYAISI